MLYLDSLQSRQFSHAIESMFFLKLFFTILHSVFFAKALGGPPFAAEINLPCIEQRDFNCLHNVADDKNDIFLPTVFLFV